MINPSLLRNSLEEVVLNYQRRGAIFNQDMYSRLEERRHALAKDLQSLREQINENSKQVGIQKQNNLPADDLLATAGRLKKQLSEIEQEESKNEQELQHFLLRLPNLLLEEVPFGKDEHENKVVRQHLKVKNDKAIPHDDLFPISMDFATAATMSGSRFVILRNQLARLSRALMNFMVDTHVDRHGFTEVTVPYLVGADALTGTGQLPKFEEDLFKITGDKPRYLIPTAEVPITNLLANQIIPLDQLPLKYVGATPCFRSEAGSYGKDTKGLIRQHQFDKVELVIFTIPEKSQQMHEQLLSYAEEILQQLQLPYQVTHLCSGDTGFASASTYDLEVYMPSQQKYREVSSCSQFTDFQTRRLKARYRDPQQKKPQLLYSLNGSALAIGRTIAALVENHQENGEYIRIPKALQPYFGKERLDLDTS